MHPLPSGWRDIPMLARVRRYCLVFLVATLSVSVLLKIGQIQYLELILAADFLALVGIFFRNKLKAKIFNLYFSIGMSYAIFLSLAFFLSIIALQQNFFVPPHDTFLKKPILLTISRMVELFLDVFYMLYLANAYREDERLCAFGAKMYYLVGIAGGIYAIVTYPLNCIYGLDLGTYDISHRLRGFNNEGGSYGTYLISVCMLSFAMYRRGWLSRRQFYSGLVLLVVCMIGSRSKAAFGVIVVMTLIDLMLVLKGWHRWPVIVGVCVIFIASASIFNLGQQIEVYARASASYQQISVIRPNDENVVMGRVSGAFLAPRMIAAHPWLGIGWGNYPLVRDDPQYRHGTAFAVDSIDSPSLGPIDYIVELGFPLWLYLTWIEIKPVYLLRRHGANIWLLNMAMMQPLSNWFGAHLNITYPWVIVGLALGMGFRKDSKVWME